MATSRAARRYALALFEVAAEAGGLDPVSADVRELSRLVRDSADLRLFLKSPVINAERKKAALTALFREKVHEITYRFVILMAAKGREGHLAGVFDEYLRIRDDRLGILNATVTSAARFSKEQEEALAGRIGRATAKTARLQFVIDPALIGGFTVQYEDTVWDGSVRRQLELLRLRFAMGAV